MENHHGETVEHIVRKNGYSITDLADALNVNRRTIYNYFQSKYLKYDVIYKIGLTVRHDFSKEFPDLFISEEFQVKSPQSNFINQSKDSDEAKRWKDKYIALLEQYNQMFVTPINAQ